MPRLWAKTVTYDSISVGDQLPILAKWETEETIAGFNSLLHPGDEPKSSTPSAAGQASVPALSAYVLELLEKGFPIASILAAGSSLAIESILPVHAEDVITLTGRVVDKRQEGDRRVIACQVVVENQDGQTVAEALAEVCLP